MLDMILERLNRVKMRNERGRTVERAERAETGTGLSLNAGSIPSRLSLVK